MSAKLHQNYRQQIYIWLAERTVGDMLNTWINSKQKTDAAGIVWEVDADILIPKSWCHSQASVTLASKSQRQSVIDSFIKWNVFLGFTLCIR